MVKQKKIPLRTCVISKEKCEKKDLFRVVRNKDGEVFLDLTLKANGRGAYLKKDIDVINKAKNNKQLERHLECEINDNIYDEMIMLLK